MENKIAYGIAKGMGIDTTDMSPKEVWEVIAKKKGVSVEQAQKQADNNASNDSRKRAVEKLRELTKPKKEKKTQMTAEDKIASVHIDFDKDNILPELDKYSLKIMGAEKSKPVLLKKSTIDRNFQEHSDLTKEDFQSIIAQALYEPSEVFPANAEKPYWHFAKLIKETSKGHSKIGLALLDIDVNKESFEVAHAHFVGAKGLARAKNKVIKKD